MPLQNHSYETAFIVNAGLDDPQIEAAVEKVKEAIVKNGGTVQDVDLWGRKRFSYPLRKKNNGYYVICTFQGTGDTVAKLDRFYQLEDNILRHLTIVLTKKALASRAQKAAEDREAEMQKDEAAKEETPVAEATKAEPPKAEAPEAEAPKAEAPKAEAPEAEAPEAEAPEAEAPKAEAPKVEAATTEAVKVEVQNDETPAQEAPTDKDA